MSIRIRELRIKDFRGVRGELHLRFEDPRGEPLDRIVLAGVNGSGKTSVLEGVLLALGREDLIDRDLPTRPHPSHWKLTVGLDAEIEVSIISSQHLEGPDHFRWLGGRHANMPPGATVWMSLQEAGAQYRFHGAEYFSSSRSPALAGSVKPKLAGGTHDDSEANRLIGLKQRIVDERARRAFVRLSRGDHQTRDAEWLQRLNAVWTAFHDDGSVLDADIVDPEDDDSGFDLFVFDGDQRRCSIDQLSSGELELLTMAGTLILQDFDGLLLIDEPELHLHPEWQRGLLDALRAMAPEAQLILATHSSEIWDQVYSFERFFLAPPGDPRAAPDEVVSA